MPVTLQPALSECLRDRPGTFSIEFFPPKDDDSWERFRATAAKLASLKPDFVSITYGAGGTTQERTLRAALELKDDYGFIVMPHLTCVGSDEAAINKLVEGWLSHGFRNIMALRGDPPKGETSFQPVPGGPRYGSDLVKILRRNFPEISVGVGGYPEMHPEAPEITSDLRNLQTKCDAGADFITTQLFFDNKVFTDFVAKCREIGITQPIIAGIMPVMSFKQIKRFTAMCGATLPPALIERLTAANGDSEAEENVGIDWACEQISELLDQGVAGIHLYALNRARAAVSLAQRLPRPVGKI